MGYVGERLASSLGGLSWTILYVTLIVLYVVIHYLFVSQTSQVLALFGVFLDVGTGGGVPLPLMSFGLLFASSYFSVITPQGEARTSSLRPAATSGNASSSSWGSLSPSHSWRYTC